MITFHLLSKDRRSENVNLHFYIEIPLSSSHMLSNRHKEKIRTKARLSIICVHVNAMQLLSTFLHGLRKYSFHWLLAEVNVPCLGMRRTDGESSKGSERPRVRNASRCGFPE